MTQEQIYAIFAIAYVAFLIGLSIYMNKPEKCKKCGSTEFTKDGYDWKKTCKNCGYKNY